MAVLADVHPRLADRLNEARQRNPERAEWALRQMWPRLHHLVELRSDNPDLYKLRVADQRHKVETLRLVQQLRVARLRNEDPKRIEALREDLRKRVNEHFEVRQRMRQHELEQLAERVEQLRKELSERRANRDELISRYINALLDRKARGEKPSDLD